jgi:hypothetical protein
MEINMIVVIIDKSRDSMCDDLCEGMSYECDDWSGAPHQVYISLKGQPYLYLRECFKPLEEIREEKINTILE